MKSITALAALAALSLAGCARVPVMPDVAAPVQAAPAVEVKPPVAPESAPSPAKSAGMPAQALTEQVLYQYLLAEVAWQRGERKLAAEAYTDLALRTRDARIARRATELALFAQLPQQAIQAARLWVELEPDSERAQQTWVSLLAAGGRIQETRPHLEALLKAAGPAAGPVFLQLHSLFGRNPDPQAVLDLVVDLARGYPDLAEAQLAVAQAAWAAGQHEQAEQALDRALALKPRWEALALFKGRLLLRQGDEAPLAYWREYLTRNPDAREVRQAYAKQLATMGRYAESRQEFERLLSGAPNNPDAHLAVGLLAMQAGDFEAAEAHLLKAIELGHPEADQVKLYLGQINEARNRPEAALRWYGEVAQGPRYLEAQLLRSILLGKSDRVAEARALLQNLSPANEAERIQIIQTEAQVLRGARDYPAVYQLLTEALARYPDSPDLIYDRSMAAEKLGKLEVVEQDLRRLIKLRPDHAHAYNALGYTLADRTTRLAEAIELLQKALQLVPNDPFIQDSMGWALYKAGRLAEAEDYLKRAYAARPDPEIAAHLGEVLWREGRRDEAQRLWEGALKAHPDNESLRETISRLKP
ncbi:MAG: tetratricopeptide repeat protein [Hydrogenophilaceae bacterium]|nr:tetratricopeptide repeat protein [Hydrogenophilaceae bacterium]